jgi:hypothetical protein
MKWYVIQFAVMSFIAVSTLIILVAFNVDIPTLNKCMSIESVLLIASGILMLVKERNEKS